LSSDALPVVPLVVGLLVLGGVAAALLARRSAGRLAQRRRASKPGRLDSN
jgi:F0F1-type ATP synthase assembly protein I